MAFALCPADQETMQQVVDRIVEVLVQVSGDPSAGERFVAFQTYGPLGPDRKPGTDDDLSNPFLVYAK